MNGRVKFIIIVERFKPKNIYNSDEKGLLFCTLPSKTLSVENENFKLRKLFKERLTIFLSVNMEVKFTLLISN